MSKEQIPQYRNFMKSNFYIYDEVITDQQKQLPYPPLAKGVEQGQKVIPLPEVSGDMVEDVTVFDAIRHRRSVRKYADHGLSLEGLAFLLYCTQGVRHFKEGKYSFRTVPSGGARQPFETYLAVNSVDGLTRGIYRYQAFEHALVLIYEDEAIGRKTSEGALDQKFAAEAAVTFIWSCIPYRTEWRYDITAHKTMLLDAGHVCQNLYIACEALGAGTCAIAAYDQTLMDQLVKVDGDDEFVVYMAPVGMKQKV